VLPSLEPTWRELEALDAANAVAHGVDG
jgi:hypothetical protein